MANNNNYISINGKKIPLTNEQVEQIKSAGIVKDNPFERVKRGQKYFLITTQGGVRPNLDFSAAEDNSRYNVANYCTDKKLLEQRALHETLNRLLWRFSMTHGGDEIDWNSNIDKYHICYDHNTNSIEIYCNDISQDLSTIHFKYEKTAEQAIEEIVKPFMKEHPEFVW